MKKYEEELLNELTALRRKELLYKNEIYQLHEQLNKAYKRIAQLTS